MKTIHKILLPLPLIFAAVFFILSFFQTKPIIDYAATFIISSAFFIVSCWIIIKFKIPKKYLTVLIITGIIVKIAFLFIHPTGSDDYYRYVWDGKVFAHGINPYRYAPEDQALINLHTATLPGLVNYPDMKTIYPPLSQILFYISYLIGGDGYFGIKLLLLLFDTITLYGIFLIIRKLNLEFKYLLIYVLSPLIFFQIFVDAHVDGFGLPFFVFAIYTYLSNRKILGYLLIGLSICIKPLAFILIPILFFNEKTFREKIKTLIIPVLIIVALYVPFIFNGYPFQALLKFTENWTFNGIVFDILDSFVRDNQRSRLICALIFLLFYLPIILSKKELLNKIYLSIFLLFIFSPVVHPWYLTWLAVLIPFIPRWSGIAFVSLISLTIFTVMNYQLNGIWKEYNYVLVLEYLPVLFLFALELIKSNRIIKRPIAAD